jgi:hypothetical protein
MSYLTFLRELVSPGAFDPDHYDPYSLCTTQLPLLCQLYGTKASFGGIRSNNKVDDGDTIARGRFLVAEGDDCLENDLLDCKSSFICLTVLAYPKPQLV